MEGIQKIKETCDSDHENVKDMLKVLMREHPVPKLVSASKRSSNDEYQARPSLNKKIKLSMCEMNRSLALHLLLVVVPAYLEII